MSHATRWRCNACLLVLGRIERGQLVVYAPDVTEGAAGVKLVRCPQCGSLRTWTPEQPDKTPEVNRAYNVPKQR